MSAIPSISDALKTVVTATDAAIKANPDVNFGSLPKAVYFMHGNIKEIMAVLQSMTESPADGDKKFPLIALFRDVKETLGENLHGIGSVIKNAHLAIFTLTNQEYRAEDRKLHSFDPILIPILEEFIKQLGMSRAFGMPSVKDLAITKWDCYFYGTQIDKKNPLNDFVDAIDIESISLRLRNIC